MGNAESSSPTGDMMAGYGSHDGDPYDPFDGEDTLGYRVLGVQPSSPASEAGLVSFLDFLVGANQRMLLGSGEGLSDGEEYDDVDLPGLLEENKGMPIEFLVYNIKSQESRLVDLTPSDAWGGAGLLGVTIRLDNYAGAEERLIRVLEVEDKSPAAAAGLIPFKDFLLGTTTTTLDSTDTLADLLRSNQDKIVELYVYNCDTDVVRVVALMPTLSWGRGKGLLGAAVGTGYLHRLPSSTRTTEGSSVERKVRYVGVDNSSGTGGGRAANASIPALGALSNKGMLELEPQLEMEREDSCDSSQDASAADMSSVALSVDDVSPAHRASTSARGVVVETVAMHEPGEAIRQKQPEPTAEDHRLPAATTTWMEPVRLQERESSNSGRVVESHNTAVDRDVSHGVASGTDLSSVGQPARAQQPIESRALSQAESPIPSAKPSLSFLPPPPKMHYTAST